MQMSQLKKKKRTYIKTIDKPEVCNGKKSVQKTEETLFHPTDDTITEIKQFW